MKDGLRYRIICVALCVGGFAFDCRSAKNVSMLLLESYFTFLISNRLTWSCQTKFVYTHSLIMNSMHMHLYIPICSQ